MKIIRPDHIVKAIKNATKEIVARIVKEESEAAAARVQERVISECTNLTVELEERMDHMGGRDEISIVLVIREFKE